jgi:hypothetical protein
MVSCGWEFFPKNQKAVTHTHKYSRQRISSQWSARAGNGLFRPKKAKPNIAYYHPLLPLPHIFPDFPLPLPLASDGNICVLAGFAEQSRPLVTIVFKKFRGKCVTSGLHYAKFLTATKRENKRRSNEKTERIRKIPVWKGRKTNC